MGNLMSECSWKLNLEDMVRALNIAFLVFMLLSLFFLDGDGVAPFPSTSPCCCCGSFNSSLHANNLHLRRWIALVFVRQRTDSIPASEVAASAARLDSVRVLHNVFTSAVEIGCPYCVSYLVRFTSPSGKYIPPVFISPRAHRIFEK